MMGNTIGRILGARGVPSDVSGQDQQQSPDEMHNWQGALPQQIENDFLQLLNRIYLLRLVELSGSLPNDPVNNIPQQQVPANPQLVLQQAPNQEIDEDIPQEQNLIEQPPNLNVQNPQQQIPVVHGQPPNQALNVPNPQQQQIPVVHGQPPNQALNVQNQQQIPVVRGQLQNPQQQQIPVVLGQPPNRPLNVHNAQQLFPNLLMLLFPGLQHQHQYGYIRFQYPYAGNILPVLLQGNLPHQNLGIPRYNIPAGNMHGMVFPGHIPQQHVNPNGQQQHFVLLPMLLPLFQIANGHIPAQIFAQNFPAPQNLAPQNLAPPQNLLPQQDVVLPENLNPQQNVPPPQNLPAENLPDHVQEPAENLPDHVQEPAENHSDEASEDSA